MFKLLIWIIWLVLLLCISYLSSKRVLLSPQFGLIAMFIPQAVYAVFYVKKWDLDLSEETLLILLLGTGIFVLVSILVDYFIIRANAALRVTNDIQNNECIKLPDSEIIKISTWKLLAFLCFQVMIIGLEIFFTYQNGGQVGLAENIGLLRRNYMLGEGDLRLPRVLLWGMRVNQGGVYIFLYLLIHSIVYTYKQHRILLGLNTILGVIQSFFEGGRYGIVMAAVAAITQAYFLYGRKQRWHKEISLKSIFKVLILGVILLLSYQWLGNLVGRNNETNVFDYIGVYLSAELKNLDIFVRNGKFGADIFHSNTLIGIRNALDKIGIDGFAGKIDLPYHSVNGYALGNVYTMFYSFIYDGGYFGLFFYTSLCAVISQIVFVKARKISSRKTIDMYVIVYSVFFFYITFSFFGDVFYERLLRTTTFWQFIVMLILRRFFVGSKVRRRGQEMGRITAELN